MLVSGSPDLLFEDREDLELGQDSNRMSGTELQKCLLDPLPQGVRLYAIFDAPHCGNVLELEHTTCNDVYVPWIRDSYRICYHQPEHDFDWDSAQSDSESVRVYLKATPGELSSSSITS